MKKYLFVLICGISISFFSAAQTPIFTITTGTDHIIKAGTVVSMDGLVLTSSKDFSLSGKSLQSNTTPVNTTTNQNISKYYSFSGTTNEFSGVLQFNYLDAELNGLQEAALKLNLFFPKKSSAKGDNDKKEEDDNDDDEDDDGDDNNASAAGKWSLQKGGIINTTDNYVTNTLDAVSLSELTLGYAACIPPAAPKVSVTQPFCVVPSGTIAITSVITGLVFSIDGANYSNNSGLFAGLVPNTYRVTAKNASGCISAITEVTVMAIPKVSITAHPTSTSIELGEKASFSITVEGPVTGYQWQQLATTNGSSWSNIKNGDPYTGSTSASLKINKLTKTLIGYKYRCIVSSECGSTIVSNTATLLNAKYSNDIVDPTIEVDNRPGVVPASILAYPNPTQGAFMLGINNFSFGKALIKISDASGMIVLYKEVMIDGLKQEVAVRLDQFAKGVYFVQVLQLNKTKSLILVKQ